MSEDFEYGMQTLGLPDSLVIDLAVRTVAELLLPLDARSKASSRNNAIDRARAASCVVLESWPIELGRIEYLSRLDISTDQEAIDAARRLPRTDWLGQAKAALVAAGIDPGPDTRGMATRYGWNPCPRGATG